MDSLAARGTAFTRAYTPSPICVSARASLACGDYVHNLGYWDSATPYDGARRSWMHVLRDGGLDVASIGKLHFRSGQDDNGFTEEILPMHVVGGIGWAIGLLRKDPQIFEGGRELAAGVGSGPTRYTDYDRDIAAAAEEWIAARAAQDTPWSAFVSFVSPHFPLMAPDAFYELYDPAQLEWPIGYDEALGLQHPEIEALATFYDYGPHFDAETVRRAKAAYFGLVSYVDACVGRVLDALEKSGQAEDTIVIFTSDHGEMLGDMGLWTKMVMYEQSAGIPMIVAGPGVPAGRRVETPVSLLDIAPTALDATGLTDAAFTAGCVGGSLLEIAVAENDPDRTAFSEYHDGGSTTGSFMVRWGQWKYIHYAGLAPQLFDLESDPLELKDLAAAASGDPAVAVALSEGRRRLSAICDPDAVNRRCFEDQARRIAELGGEEACRKAYLFNHTPTPSEQAALAMTQTR